jgi:WD40 repeat protein
MNILKGHKEPVVCLAEQISGSSSQAHLASGSEDGTIRIWDVENSKCVTGIIGLEDPITSLVWSSSQNNSNNNGNPNVIYAASGKLVYAFDLRSKPLIMNSKSAIFQSDHASDEINSISIHHKESQYIATGDDSGQVHVYDMVANKVFKSMRQPHSNICNFVSFRPKRTWELWSGGMDYQILQHDFSSGKRLKSFEMDDTSIQLSSTSPEASNETDTQQTQQNINPLFVYDGSFSADGNTLVTGLGDGSVCFIEEQRKPKPPGGGGKKGSSSKSSTSLNVTRYACHTWSTTAVKFIAWNQSVQPQEQQEAILSGGLDGNLQLWLTPSSISSNETTSTTTSTSASWSPVKSIFTAKKINCIASIDRPNVSNGVPLVFVGGCNYNSADDATKSSGDIGVFELRL